MLSEQHLQRIEANNRNGNLRPRCPVVSHDELRQLIAAARVANAAARVQQEVRDGGKRERWDAHAYYPGTSSLVSADNDLARALRLYTAGEPAGVKS